MLFTPRSWYGSAWMRPLRWNFKRSNLGTGPSRALLFLHGPASERVFRGTLRIRLPHDVASGFSRQNQINFKFLAVRKKPKASSPVRPGDEKAFFVIFERGPT